MTYDRAHNLTNIRMPRSSDAALAPQTIGINLGTDRRTIATTAGGQPMVIPPRDGSLPSSSFASVIPDVPLVAIQAVATRMLREVRAAAEEHLGGLVEGAVIAVPAYFGEARRAAVRRAAEDAKVPVIRVITEPTAAAIAFGRQMGFKGRVAVVQVGANTFGLSVVDLRGNEHHVVATGGEPALGGRQIDDAIASRLGHELMKANPEASPLTPSQVARIRELAEVAKMGLGLRRNHAVVIPHFAMRDGEPAELRMTLTRANVEFQTRPVLDQMVETASRILERHGVTVDSIDELLFIGGATRWAPLQECMELLFRRRGTRRAHHHDVVAMGAALAAADRAGDGLAGVLPTSIGFAGRDGRFFRLVARGTKVPVERVFVVESDGGEGGYVLSLLRGESVNACENERLGSLVIDGWRADSSGRSYELTLALDAQGAMTASAIDTATQAQVPVDFDPGRHDDSDTREPTGAHVRADAPTETSSEGGSPLFRDRVRSLFRSRSA